MALLIVVTRVLTLRFASRALFRGCVLNVHLQSTILILENVWSALLLTTTVFFVIILLKTAVNVRISFILKREFVFNVLTFKMVVKSVVHRRPVKLVKQTTTISILIAFARSVLRNLSIA